MSYFKYENFLLMYAHSVLLCASIKRKYRCADVFSDNLETSQSSNDQQRTDPQAKAFLRENA